NSALKAQKNHQLKTLNIKDFDGNVEEFNLVIFYQIPNNTSDFSQYISDFQKSKVSQFFFIGSNSDYNQLPKWNLPLQLDVNPTELNDVYIQYNDAFPLFKMEDEQL